MDFKIRPFERRFAPIVVSWVRTERDLFWLAPRTSPPLTRRKLFAWHSEFCSPYLLFAPHEPHPCGYGEINVMCSDPDRYWLGHVIIDPHRRRQGLGSALVRLLAHLAFAQWQAKGISLVVFPANQPAANCYLRCGFTVSRNEYHQFPPTAGRGGKHRMLRMELDRPRWWNVVHRGDSEPPQTPLPATAALHS